MGNRLSYIWSDDLRGYTHGYWALAADVRARHRPRQQSSDIDRRQSDRDIVQFIRPYHSALGAGTGRIGGEIIAGPWVENGKATFCISFGVPADPSGTRTLREIAFDSEVVWTAADGFSTEAFTFRLYPGTLTQAADPIEIAHFGADAVAYRPQMLLWFENLPLANTKFKKIPYVAAVIADSVGDMSISAKASLGWPTVALGRLHLRAVRNDRHHRCLQAE